MKRIILTESQYKRLVKQKLNERVIYSDPKDEYDERPNISRYLDTLSQNLWLKYNVHTYVKKIEDGIVYLEMDKYNEEQKNYISDFIDLWVDDYVLTIPNDKKVGNYDYFSGLIWNYDDEEIKDVEDTEDKEKIKVDPDHTTTVTSPKISLGTETKKGSAGRLSSKPQKNRWGKPHHGYDIVGPFKKSVIVSNKKGVVTYADECGGYGNLVEIDHGDGELSAYGHLKDIYVKKGQEITVGTPIGLEGTTGKSDGIHLHFEERVPRPEGKKDRCGKGSPYNEVNGWSTVRPISVVDNYFYYQEEL
jgi:murein DD-endopeptidase MepM/ murein hydrolase activator NlpD